MTRPPGGSVEVDEASSVESLLLPPFCLAPLYAPHCSRMINLVNALDCLLAGSLWQQVRSNRVREKRR
jgi:hypothetical protein